MPQFGLTENQTVSFNPLNREITAMLRIPLSERMCRLAGHTATAEVWSLRRIVNERCHKSPEVRTPKSTWFRKTIQRARSIEISSLNEALPQSQCSSSF
jgi:hypothetical protein